MLSIKRSVLKIITAIVCSFPADKTLRILFWIDRWLYYFEGRIASQYDSGTHTKHRHMNYHRFFVQNIREDERIIDIGCGIGAVAHTIAQESNVKITGIDLDETRIKQASEQHNHPNIEYLVGDVLVDLPDEAFDVVILSNVLEHLPGRPDFLKRIQEQLKPLRILIRVPLFERDWRVPLKKELGVEWRLDPTHQIEYTQESFASEMKEANLRIRSKEIRWGEIWAVTEPK